MSTFFEQVATLITTPPGNLSYHLVLTLAIGGALALVLRNKQPRSDPQMRRLLLGLGALLGLRLVLFFFSLLAWQGLVDAHTLLPAIDRGITALSLLLILWIWAFPTATRNQDIAALLVGVFLLTCTGLTVGLWSGNNAALTFNAFWLDAAWAFISLLLAVAGVVLLVIRKPQDWETGLTLIALLGFGHLTHLIFPNTNGDFPAAVRLAQMAAYPLLLMLTTRGQASGRVQVFPATPATDRPITQERRRYTASPKTLAALLSVMVAEKGEEVCHHITNAMAHAMVADICLLIGPPDSSGNLTIHCGYDLIREAAIEGRTIHRKQVPLLSSALERRRALRLPASSTSSDLLHLGQLLGLGHAGHMLVAPIPGPHQELLAGLILLSPYARRTWTVADQEYLQPILPLLGQAITRQHQQTQSAEQSTVSQEAPHEESEETLSTMESLAGELETTYRSLAALERENKELYENLARAEETANQEIERLNSELRLTLEEVAHLKNRLAEAQAQVDALRQQLNAQPQDQAQPDNLSSEQLAIITSLAQELRQPMFSIVGYTDLLLGESVGILGALQRKFLERIKASITRMEGLLDDLIRVVTDSGQAKLSPTPVDLAEVIDKAIAQSQQHIREKNLLLKVDLPDEMPKLIADRDALQQILIYLLTNASLATPEDGEVLLKVKQVSEDGEHFVVLQVADSGGGIPEEDIPRVFSRLYRADNPLIEGVGDTGVGLSIAKALTEAQNGRIWVESEPGKGATFSVMLPTTAIANADAEAA